MERTGGKFATHQHGGTCQVCGAHAVYMGVFYHKPTNEYIQTGWECAGNICQQAAEGIKKFQFRCKEELKYQTGKKKAKEILESKGLSEAWSIYENETSSDVFEEKKIRHYVDVLIRYGDLYDRQWDYVKDLIKRLQEKKNPKPTVSLPPVPCGRISIVGKVLNTKPNLVWGGLNMLVEMNEGWKIWGRVPNNLRREESFGRGDPVQLRL